MTFGKLPVAIVLALATMNAVQAQEATTENMVEAQADNLDVLDATEVTATLTRYSATKSDTPIMETARSIAVITDTAMEEKGASTVSDAVSYSSGVTGNVFGVATRGDWLRVRGLNIPQYRDSLQSLFGSYNNTRAHPYTLEQVEVLKGPASVLYGQGSPGGLVNLVSKTPSPYMENEVFLRVGNFAQVDAGADIGGSLNSEETWFYRVVAVREQGDNDIDQVDNQRWVIAPSLSFQPSEDTDITLMAEWQNQETKAAAQFLPIYGTLLPAPNGQRFDPYGFYGEPGFDRYDVESQSYTMLANHQINGSWGVEATARYTKGESDYRQSWVSFIGGDRWVYNADGSLYRDGFVPRSFYDNPAASEQLATDLRFRGQFDTGSLSHEVLIGGQFQEVDLSSRRTYLYAVGFDLATRQPDTTFGDYFWINPFNPTYGRFPTDAQIAQFQGPKTQSNVLSRGLYLSDQISVGNWRFTGGLRADWVKNKTPTSAQKDDAVSVSLGALYAFDSGWSPYFSYAESFEPVIGMDTVTQKPLKPKEGKQYELGVKYQPLGSQSQITAAVFDIDITNLPNPNSQPGGVSQQEGTSNIRGFELEGTIHFGDFQWQASWTGLDTEDPNGFRMPSVPNQQFATWLNWTPEAWDGFKTGVGLRYTGDTMDGTDALKTPSYTLIDAMASYDWGQWSFALNARNLSDKKYFTTCLSRGDCFVGERRHVMLTTRYRFE